MAEKLIRDNVPRLALERSGDVLPTRVADESEMLWLLAAKLKEEAAEFAHADEAHRAEELADVIQVVDAILTRLGVDRVYDAMDDKAARSGVFEERIVLALPEGGSPSKEQLASVGAAVLKEFEDRSGFDNLLDGCDRPLREEIRDAVGRRAWDAVKVGASS